MTSDKESIGWSWSLPEDQKLARMWLADDPPRSVREIAEELSRSKSAVSRRIATLDLRGSKGDRQRYEKLTGVALDPVLRPVRVEMGGFPTTQPTSSNYSMLVWSDVHYPFQDEAVVNILEQVARDLQPEVLMCLGDVFDFYGLSSHRSPADDSGDDVQDALNLGAVHLARLRSISGAKQAYFLAGNHEDRWDRMLEQARKDVRFRQLLRLPAIKRALDFEEVVGFDELGYEYHPYMEGSPLVWEDKMVFTHGSLTNKHTAFAMMQKYGKSVMFGHMHRIQNFTKRDLKGQEAGWCIGCCCSLDPHYNIFSDWHHGFAVVSWTKTDGDWLFSVEQIRVHSGVAAWRDKIYHAEV